MKQRQCVHWTIVRTWQGFANDRFHCTICCPDVAEDLSSEAQSNGTKILKHCPHMARVHQWQVLTLCCSDIAGVLSSEGQSNEIKIVCTLKHCPYMICTPQVLLYSMLFWSRWCPVIGSWTIKQNKDGVYIETLSSNGKSSPITGTAAFYAVLT